MMRIKRFSIAALCLAAVMSGISCIGSYSLFNKLAAWNREATDSKFLNELIFLVISPAYPICLTADSFILNTIEFWTGSNPMASNIGKTRQVLGQDGKYYAVKTLRDGYEITSPDGSKYNFVYNEKDDSWSQVQNGETKELFRFNDDGTVKVTLNNGKRMDVALNAAGVNQVRMAQNDGSFWAFN